MYRPFRNAALFLGSILLPIAGVMFFAFGPFGCDRWSGPRGRGHWPAPAPFTPEPPSPHSVLDPWDASVPPPQRPGSKPLPAGPNAHKPVKVVGDLRFYFPYQVQALAVSPDGKLLACSAGGRFVLLFDAETGLETGRLYTPDPDAVGIGGLAFSPDSKSLYSNGCVWDVTARRGLARLYSAKDWALSGDGKTLATLEQVGVKWVGHGPEPAVYVARPVVRLRDTETWKETEAFAAPANVSLALSPDARYVAIGGNDGIVRVWDRTARKELPPLTELSEKPPGEPEQYKPAVTRLLFSPDGTMLAGVRGGPGHVMQELGLWTWPEGSLAHRLPISTSEGTSLAFTADSRRLLAVGGGPKVWDTATGAVLGEWDEKKHYFGFGAAIAPDGSQIYTPGPEWRLQKLSVPDLAPLPLDPPVRTPELPFETQEIIDPKQDRVLSDGSVLRAGGYSQYGVLHLSAKGKPLRHFAEGDSGMFDVSDDGRFLATYGKKAGTGNPQSLSLRFWDIASGALVTSLPLETRFYLSRFRFSPDGRRLATLHAGGFVCIWDIARKETILSLAADGHAVYDLRFSRDGKFLVGGLGNAPAVIWDLAEAK